METQRVNCEATYKRKVEAFIIGENVSIYELIPTGGCLLENKEGVHLM